jgi:hypothetical protein
MLTFRALSRSFARSAMHSSLLAGLTIALPMAAHAQLSDLSLSGATNAIENRLMSFPDGKTNTSTTSDPQASFSSWGPTRYRMRSTIAQGPRAWLDVTMDERSISIEGSALSTKSSSAVESPFDNEGVWFNVDALGTSHAQAAVAFTLSAPSVVEIDWVDFMLDQEVPNHFALSKIDGDGVASNTITELDPWYLNTTLTPGQYVLSTSGVGTLKGNFWSVSMNVVTVPEPSTGVMWLLGGLLFAGALKHRQRA